MTNEFGHWIPAFAGMTGVKPSICDSPARSMPRALTWGNEKSEVIFTLIAERYERRSLGIASNLVISQWECIFANPMSTAAAIDRVVHHAVILEFERPRLLD